ncbi:MAG: YicC family protein [Bacteroidales bacterium]|nr:YicC family protein [Bacteroidales bacterium]
MIKSMTGFGKVDFNSHAKNIVVEIRSLNSKQLDLNARIAPLFRDKENEIRSLLAQRIERGKVDFSIYVEKNEAPSISINKELAAAYFQELNILSKELDNPVESDIFTQILRMPDVVTTPREELPDELWEAALNAISEACDKLDQFRVSEGVALAADFEKRVRLIDSLIDEITPFEKQRIVAQREKFEKGMEDLRQKGQYDPNRLEQEMIFYIEKLDITEEKVRLRKHCNYFLETMNEPESKGKKLGFIVQEMGREVNTTGSKACDFNIQQIVVKMKDEVEKLKEQLANVL